MHKRFSCLDAATCASDKRVSIKCVLINWIGTCQGNAEHYDSIKSKGSTRVHIRVYAHLLLTTQDRLVGFVHEATGNYLIKTLGTVLK